MLVARTLSDLYTVRGIPYDSQYVQGYATTAVYLYHDLLGDVHVSCTDSNSSINSIIKYRLYIPRGILCSQ